MRDDDRRRIHQAYMDNIYGTFELHPAIHEVIKTPIFERLRSIQQLGTSKYVYATGNGNRYVHCIGTSHLADKFMEKLFKELSTRENYEINDVDILCVCIARVSTHLKFLLL